MSATSNRPSTLSNDLEIVWYYISKRSPHVVLNFTEGCVDYQKDALEALTHICDSVAVLVQVANAAKRYRDIGLADPTSLDLAPVGSDLDSALRAVIWELDR